MGLYQWDLLIGTSLDTYIAMCASDFLENPCALMRINAHGQRTKNIFFVICMKANGMDPVTGLMGLWLDLVHEVLFLGISFGTFIVDIYLVIFCVYWCLGNAAEKAPKNRTVCGNKMHCPLFRIRVWLSECLWVARVFQVIWFSGSAPKGRL